MFFDENLYCQARLFTHNSDIIKTGRFKELLDPSAYEYYVKHRIALKHIYDSYYLKTIVFCHNYWIYGTEKFSIY